MDFHGIIDPHHGDFIVFVQWVCTKVKDKLVLHVVWMMRDSYSSLGPNFSLVILQMRAKIGSLTYARLEVRCGAHL